MIWIIGDIHGMFDPLKRLMSMLQATHSRGKPELKIDKLIFLGDYIDYGPSSKEVIDYIIDLPFEKVFLLGNHDDLLLQFIHHSDLAQKYGNVWFRGNGGQQTVHSFFPDRLYGEHEEDVSTDAFPLDKKYLNFFQNLKATHVEEMGEWKLAFAHAILNTKFPIDEQLSIKTYEDVHHWRRENKVWIEDTLLWNKEDPKERFGDYVLVHGHIPTPNLGRVWKNLHDYDVKLELPFLKFDIRNRDSSFYSDRYGDRMGYTGNPEQLIAINADTGAVYGNRLTAVGIPNNGLEYAMIWVFQVSTGVGYRLEKDFHSCNITFHGF